jgi:hypothetical protein
MAYELTGTIKLIFDPKTFASGFTKREMVVTVEDGRFEQEILLEFVQDKVSLLDSLSPGDDVTVTFDIRGREYNGRYFNNLQGWKVEQLGEGASIPHTDEAPPFPSPDDFEDSDIPF